MGKYGIMGNKKVINGENELYFNILPLKYHWAYNLYKKMKANHWEPEDVGMLKDRLHWKEISNDPLSPEKRIIEIAIGYFSAAEGIVGDNILNVIRDNISAPEIKLVLGRHAHEENIHTDSLLYIIESLGIDANECAEKFMSIKSVVQKTEFVFENSNSLRKGVNLSTKIGKQEFAKNIFLFGQCMEGIQFFGLFAIILNLYRKGLFVGIGQIFRYTLRDESNHIELLRLLFLELLKENPEIIDDEFFEDLKLITVTSANLEKNFIVDCFGGLDQELTVESFFNYINFLCEKRLIGIGLINGSPKEINPFPWLSETIEIEKEQNFFEGRVTEYQSASSLIDLNDNEL